jgi:hypothetical protein
MRGARLGVAVALVAATWAAADEARAESGATLVAIVTAEPNASLTRRVRAELQGLGLDVIVIKPPDEGSASRAPLEQAARSVGAIAAVRLIASSEGKVEVWVADRVTGKAVVRELDAAESGASDAAHGDAPTNQKIESLALPASAEPRVARLGLNAGAGAELGIRGLGPSADADIGVWLRIASHVGARFVGHTSLSPAHVLTGAGAVDVRSQLFGAMATYAFADASSAWAPSASIGIAAAHVATTGTAAVPYVSASEATWSAAPLGAIGVAWSLAPGLRLRGDGLAVLALPPVHVSTPTTDVGWWGAPALIVSLGVEVLWRP